MAKDAAPKDAARVITGSASAHLAADADRAFEVITDLDDLPSWNERIVRTVDRPDGLTTGDSWTVRIKLMGSEFDSTSTVLTHDPATRMFEYRSKPDLDNPTYTVWRWQVTPARDGCDVALSWELHALTPSRRLFVSPLRNRMIRRTEAPASLAALGARCARDQELST